MDFFRLNALVNHLLSPKEETFDPDRLNFSRPCRWAQASKGAGGTPQSLYRVLIFSSSRIL